MGMDLISCHRSEEPQPTGANSPVQQLHWFLHDPRLLWADGGTPAADLDVQWPHWVKLGRSQGHRALLWIRHDVEVHDHFLADRILELDPGVWEIKDRLGCPMLRIDVGLQAEPAVHASQAVAMSLALKGQSETHVSSTLRDAPELLVVTATRHAAEDFYAQTALGRSVQRLRQHGASIRLLAVCNNDQALAHAYNRVLSSAHIHDLVVFVHDDVTLHDWHLGIHLNAALQHYDLVGVAGSKTLNPHQPSWAFPERVGVWGPKETLLGSVGHHTLDQPSGSSKFHGLTRYGSPKGSATLLDGVFMAAKVKSLVEGGVRFDPRFAFHFYDLDICRQALAASLVPGVWPLAITHHSGGQFQTPSWQQAYEQYLQKWKVPA